VGLKMGTWQKHMMASGSSWQLSVASLQVRAWSVLFAWMYSTAQLKQESHFIVVEMLLLSPEEENLLFKNYSTLQIILCQNNDILLLIYSIMLTDS
jgi:hypothetical protein